ncbi:MAG: phosphonate C-P lyase system protein PhnL [Desulfovibrio sp.]|jgi:alpha-D-ribose 1-methylphosphonate 5-triphosphate synthase subunit PhnL|nr:phosphonate C-P lyase system protein PhnL [Desulfovibrio sp.]
MNIWAVSGARVSVRGLCKSFVLHVQAGARIDALENIDLDVWPGECLALHGPSGAGKSTLLRLLYGNYRPDRGDILVRCGSGSGAETINMAAASPREVLAVRQYIMGYVSQFLRVIPRVSSLNLVAERLMERGEDEKPALEKARTLLERLRMPERLWSLPPATFSGGEQQRVNIARGFIREDPLLLLDEPTASLDAANRDTVVAMIQDAKAGGAAVVGIFHDDAVREAVADRVFKLESRALPAGE